MLLLPLREAGAADEPVPIGCTPPIRLEPPVVPGGAPPAWLLYPLNMLRPPKLEKPPYIPPPPPCALNGWLVVLRGDMLGPEVPAPTPDALVAYAGCEGGRFHPPPTPALTVEEPKLPFDVARGGYA